MFVMELDVRRTRTLTLRVPTGINDLLERAYRDLGYSTKSDFIREAVREYIDEVLKKSTLNLNLGGEKVRIGSKPKTHQIKNTRLLLIR
ncbi:MAG: ribbon-helix-helix domain-containing protein [Desulfurococcaceae archaeon TW002]